MPEQIELWHWFAFGGTVVLLLALDLFVFHRRSRAPTLRAAAGWTVVWCSLALAFNGFVWHWRGTEAAQQFLAGYLVEWTLSMDNVFVFAVIFRFFRVPIEYQYRVLFWGILGAVGLRLAFILAGAKLIATFHWVLLLFGLFLVYTAVKLALAGDAEVHPEKNAVRRFAQRLVRVSQGDHREHGQKFFVRENGHFCFTPLFLVLLVVESTDVLFAVDSIPAIFGITNDKFIIFTSNIFAILGLRALYFLLAGAIQVFRYLNYGLAVVLGFIGLAMIAEYANEAYFAPQPAAPAVVEQPAAPRAEQAAAVPAAESAAHETPRLVPTSVKLGVIVAVLALAVGASIAANARDRRQAAGRGSVPPPGES